MPAQISHTARLDSLGNLHKQLLPANMALDALIRMEKYNISPAMNQHGIWVPGQQVWLSRPAATAEISSSCSRNQHQLHLIWLHHCRAVLL